MKPKIPEYSIPWLIKSTCLLSCSDCLSADLNGSIQVKSLPVQLITMGKCKFIFYNKLKYVNFCHLIPYRTQL